MDNNKIVIGFIDEGVSKWWEKEDSEIAKKYNDYFGKFEIEYMDCISDVNDQDYNVPAGNHGFWVLDRLLEVCGNHTKIKIISLKIFSRFKNDPQALLRALKYAEDKVDLLNLSIGIPRFARASKDYLDSFNNSLNKIMNNGGFTIIAAGNESEVLSNEEIIDNTNILADNEENNLSVASHSKDGQWDSFSSAGGTVDVSSVGSRLKLVGIRNVCEVSGTSFSCPSFVGICANYLIDQSTILKNKEKTSKQIIYEHLSEAVKPVYRNFIDDKKKSPWFGYGSFQNYVNYFVQYYGRDVLRNKLFCSDENLKIL